MLVLDGEHPVAAIAFTPDSTQLVSVRQTGGPIDVWTVASGKRVERLGTMKSSEAVLATHPSGRSVYVAGGQYLTQISLKPPSYHRLPGAGTAGSVITSPDGNWVIFGPRRKRQNEAIVGRRLSPYGKILLAEWEARPYVSRETLGGFIGTGEQFVTVDRNLLVIRETATGEVNATVPYPSHYVGCPTTSPDGSRFVVMGYGKLYLWATSAWGKSKRVECNSNCPFISLAYHPTRPILAAIQAEQTLVKFLDADTGKPVTKFQWKLGEMRCVAFSPDGTLAAAGSASGKIVVWDVDE